MIQISGALLHDLRTLISQGLGIADRRRGPSIQFSADANELRVRFVTGEVAVQWTGAGAFSPTTFSVPFEALREFSGGRNTPVTFRFYEGQVENRWTEAGIPKSYCFRAELPESFPEVPSSGMANNISLVQALADAAQTADSQCTRFALSYVSLRGRDGRVAATDGRQLFAQTGYAFPWEEECLVPVRQLLTCPNFLVGEKVEVGRTQDWIVVRSGAWTLWLRIKRGTRFPEIDFLVRPPASTLATLYLTGSDAQFLEKKLSQLPHGDSSFSPVTIDTSGKVAVRTRFSEDATPTELVLVQSRWEGVAISVVVDPRYLIRALQLGFRRLRISGKEAPLVLCQGDRTMVLAPLNQCAAIRPTPDTKRIESRSRFRLVANKRTLRRAGNKRMQSKAIARSKSKWPRTPHGIDAN